MLPVITRPKARIDTKSFFYYLSQDNEKVAHRFLEKIQESHSIISEFPFIAPVFETTEFSSIRWFPVKDFPNHLIFYTVNESQITVIRVLHKSQDIGGIIQN